MRTCVSKTAITRIVNRSVIRNSVIIENSFLHEKSKNRLHRKLSIFKSFAVGNRSLICGSEIKWVYYDVFARQIRTRYFLEIINFQNRSLNSDRIQISDFNLTVSSQGYSTQFIENSISKYLQNLKIDIDRDRRVGCSNRPPGMSDCYIDDIAVM